MLAATYTQTFRSESAMRMLTCSGAMQRQSEWTHCTSSSTLRWADFMAHHTVNLAFRSSTCCFSPSTACALLPPAVVRFMVAWRVSGFRVLVLPSTPILRVPCLLSPVGLRGIPAACSFWTLYLSRAASQSPPCSNQSTNQSINLHFVSLGLVRGVNRQ